MCASKTKTYIKQKCINPNMATTKFNHIAGPRDNVSTFCRNPERCARKLRIRWQEMINNKTD